MNLKSWIAFHIWKKIFVNLSLLVTETMSKGAGGLWVHLLWDRIWVHGFHESMFKQDDWNQIGWKFTKSVSICDAVFPLWQMGAHISSGRKSSEIVASVFLMATHFVPRRPDSFNMKLLLRCFISGVTFVFFQAAPCLDIVRLSWVDQTRIRLHKCVLFAYCLGLGYIPLMSLSERFGLTVCLSFFLHTDFPHTNLEEKRHKFR